MACITSVLTISSRLQKGQLVRNLQTIALIVLPIIYLAKIFEIAFNYTVTIGLLILAIQLFLVGMSAFSVNEFEFSLKRETTVLLPCIIMLLSHILQQLLTYPFGISNLSGEIHNYFMQLSDMKVSLDMYSYMMQNYIITAILLQKAILLWLTLRNFRCYFLLVNDRNPRDSQSLYQQSVRYTAIGICSCVGALNAITQYTISLF